MRFKSPGGNLVWMTPLMAVGGAWLAYDYYQRDVPAMAVLLGVLAVLAALTWLEQAWVAYPLILYFSLAVVGGAFLLWSKGFSGRGLIRIFMAGYAIYDLWEWRGRVSAEKSIAKLLGSQRSADVEPPEPSDELRQMLDAHGIPQAGQQTLFENLLPEPLQVEVTLFDEDGVRSRNGPDLCPLCLRDGCIAVGWSANGDLVVMDLTQSIGEIGYVSHDSMWQAANIRDVYHRVAGSLPEFIALFEAGRMPADFQHARELFPERS